MARFEEEGRDESTDVNFTTKTAMVTVFIIAIAVATMFYGEEFEYMDADQDSPKDDRAIHQLQRKVQVAENNRYKLQKQIMTMDNSISEVRKKLTALGLDKRSVYGADDDFAAMEDQSPRRLLENVHALTQHLARGRKERNEDTLKQERNEGTLLLKEGDTIRQG
jgi:septal ring factor EnvC (AmiA/AmiB activator)